jgi:hypothetical protein
VTSTLPTRWQEILRREAAANVGSVLEQAREQPDARRVPRWTTPALVVAVASVSLLGALRGSEVKGTGSLSFDRSTVISTRTAGLGASAEDLAPQATATPVPIPPVEPPLVSVPSRPQRIASAAPGRPQRRAGLCGMRKEARGSDPATTAGFRAVGPGARVASRRATAPPHQHRYAVRRAADRSGRDGCRSGPRERQTHDRRLRW